MTKIYATLIAVMLSTQLYADTIGIQFNKNMKKLLTSNQQEQIITNLNIQLLNFLDTNKALNIVSKGFDRNIMKRNKDFLKEYASKNNLNAIVILKYKKVTSTISIRLYLNNEQNTEIMNYSFAKKKVYDIALISAILKGFSEASIIDIKKRRI